MTGNNSYRDKGRAVFLAAIMVLSMVAMAATFVGGAAAATTDRTPTDTTVDAGDQVTVELEVTADEGDGLELVEESFSEELEIVDSSSDQAQVIEGDGSWEVVYLAAVDDDSIEYTVEVPDDAAGETYELAGSVVTTEDEFSTGTTTITVEADDDDDDENGEPVDPDPPADSYAPTQLDLIFQGEEFTVDMDDTLDGADSDESVTPEDGDIVQIRQGILGDGDGERVATSRIDADGTVTFDMDDTADLDEDFYFLRTGGLNLANTQFEIVEQDLDAEFAADIDTVNTDTELEVESDNWEGDDVRSDDFDIEVNSDDFDQDDLLEIFEDAEAAGDEEDDDPVLLTVEDGEESFAADFSDLGVEAGDEYDFDVDAVATTGADTATLAVDEFVDADASFVDRSYEADRGDIVEIDIDLDGTDEGYIDLGSEDAGYNVTVHFEADEVGDEVTILWNSYAAGSYEDGVAVDEQGTFAAAGDAAITNVQIHDTEVAGGPANHILVDGSYDLEVAPAAQDDATDVASLVLNPRSTDSVDLWTAPAGVDVEDADDIADAIGESVTATDQVAEEDNLIFQIEASGLEGPQQYYAPDGTATEQFQTAVADEVFSLEATQTNPDRNRAPAELIPTDADDDLFTVIADGEGTYYVMLEVADFDSPDDLGATRALSDTMNFDADFTVYAGEDVESWAYGLVQPVDGEAENEVVSDAFDVVDRTVSVDLDNDRVHVQAAPGQEITGETSVAPGTDINLRLQSQSQQPSQFVDPHTVTVDEDRNWVLETDQFEDRVAGTVFDISVRSGFGVSEVGEIIDPEDPYFSVSDLEPADATVDQGDLIDVSATVTNDGGQEDTQEIVLDIDGDEIDSQEVTLDEGESETVEFTDVDTADLDGTYTHTVSSDDESVSGTLTVDVDEPAEFTVSDLDPADAEFDEDDGALESLTVSATIENVGDLEGTQTITLDIDGDDVASEELTLAGGDSATVELTADASGLAPGTYTHTISSEDDSASGSLTIDEVEEDDDDPPEEDDDDPPEEDDDDDDEEPDDDGPGFGIAAALIALLGAALLAVRRQN